MNILANLATIQTPDEAQLTTRAQSALRMVESMTVENDEDYSLAADELKAIKAKANSIEAQRTGITGPINDALRAINALFKGPATFLAQAEATIKGKMIAYTTEQERIAAEERRRAEALAAAERKRIEDEARAVREAAEAEQRKLAQAEAERVRAAQAEQRRIAEESAAATNAAEREAAEKRAAEASARAEQEAAEAAQHRASVAQAAALQAAALENVASVIVAVPVTQAAAKVSGISTAKSVDFEVFDVLALVKHVAARPELLALIKPDEVKVRAYVRGLGMSANLPGVRVYQKATLRSA